MTHLTIGIDEEVLKVLKARAKKNLCSLTELVEDIVRRSAVSYKKGSANASGKGDDSLIGIFSREKKGRRK